MATREEFFKGKAKWCHLVKPDPKFPDAWSMQFYPDAESLDRINKLKSGKPAILNEIKKDDDGYFIKLRRPMSKVMRGVNTPLSPPIVTKLVDGVDAVLTDVWIGNGSDVTVGCEIYTYRKGEGLAIRLRTVRADNLVPFTPMSMDEMMKKQFGAMGEQPSPNWV